MVVILLGGDELKEPCQTLHSRYISPLDWHKMVKLCEILVDLDVRHPRKTVKLARSLAHSLARSLTHSLTW